MDAMWGLMIKEMDQVPALQSIHPMMTLLGNNILELTNHVKITRQSCINLHNWLNEEERQTA